MENKEELRFKELDRCGTELAVEISELYMYLCDIPQDAYEGDAENISHEIYELVYGGSFTDEEFKEHIRSLLDSAGRLLELNRTCGTFHKVSGVPAKIKKLLLQMYDTQKKYQMEDERHPA